MRKSKFELLNTKGKIVVYDSDGKKTKLQVAFNDTLKNLHYTRISYSFLTGLNYNINIHFYADSTSF